MVRVYSCGGPHYFDRDGQPLDLMAWADEWKQPRVLAETTVGRYRVLTMWHGHDPEWDISCPRHQGPPKIFGSIIFVINGSAMQGSERTAPTQALALEEHARLVASVHLM